MISTIFFDFSGTLVSGHFDVEGCRRSVAEYLRKKGYRVSTKRYIESLEIALQELRAEQKIGREMLFEYLMGKTLYGLGINDRSLINEIEQIEFNHYHWVPVPHILEILRALSKRYRLGIISNGITESAIHILKEMKVLRLFETVLISRNVGFRKPHSFIFNYAISQLGVSASECVFVGDNELADVSGARNTGMNVVWLDHGKHVYLTEHIDDPLLRHVSSIKEVPDAVRELESLIIGEERNNVTPYLMSKSHTKRSVICQTI